MSETEIFGRLQSKAAKIKSYQITQLALSRKLIEDKQQKIEMKIEQELQVNGTVN